MKLIVASVVLCLLGLPGAPAHADEEEAPSTVPLRYGLERRLPMGMRVEMAPGLVVAKGGKRGVQRVGYTGFVKVKAPRDLVIVKSEVETHQGEQTTWSVGVHLGGELAPTKVVGHVAGQARWFAKRAFGIR